MVHVNLETVPPGLFVPADDSPTDITNRFYSILYDMLAIWCRYQYYCNTATCFSGNNTFKSVNLYKRK